MSCLLVLLPCVLVLLLCVLVLLSCPLLLLSCLLVLLSCLLLLLSCLLVLLSCLLALLGLAMPLGSALAHANVHPAQGTYPVILNHIRAGYGQQLMDMVTLAKHNQRTLQERLNTSTLSGTIDLDHILV